jgi:hypothetical protein
MPSEAFKRRECCKKWSTFTTEAVHVIHSWSSPYMKAHSKDHHNENEIYWKRRWTYTTCATELIISIRSTELLQLMQQRTIPEIVDVAQYSCRQITWYPQNQDNKHCCCQETTRSNRTLGSIAGFISRASSHKAQTRWVGDSVWYSFAGLLSSYQRIMIM